MIFNDISILNLNTFHLNYKAKCFACFSSEEETVRFIAEKSKYPQPIFVIGKGANLLFTNDFEGTIVHPDIRGINIEEETEDKVIVSAGAGVEWDKFVVWCIENGYSGVENLSYIPGTVGATPIQNIGAYGCEVSSVIYKARAISLSDGSVKEFSNEECRFGYRDSIFKNELKGKYIFTKVFFELSKSAEAKCDYGRLAEVVKSYGEPTPLNIRKAIIQQRESKLPNYKLLGNAGSFFKNPVIDKEKASSLKEEYPNMPCFDEPNGKSKLSAAWLIDQAGLKNKRYGDACVYDKQPLVIVNLGDATGEDILTLSQIVKNSVQEKFGVSLEREVELVTI